MGDRSEQPTHSNWDLEAEEAIRDDLPLLSISHIQDAYQSNEEFLSEDEEDTDLYGILTSPLTPSTQDISTTDIPLPSPATQLADVLLPELQIQSAATPSAEPDTGNFPPKFIFPPPLEVSTQDAKGKRSSTPPTSREVTTTTTITTSIRPLPA